MKGKYKKTIAFLMALTFIFSTCMTAYADVVPSNLDQTQVEDTGGGEEQPTVTDAVYDPGTIVVPPIQLPVEQRAYEIKYLIKETGEQVPGLETVADYGDVGAEINIPHPAVEGYQVLADQPTSLTINEDESLNKVVVYYEAVVAQSAKLTVNHVLILDDGKEEPIRTDTIESLKVGDLVKGSDYAADEDGMVFVESQPTELTLASGDNALKLVYKVSAEKGLVPSEAPDFPDGTGVELDRAPNIAEPNEFIELESVMDKMAGDITIMSASDPRNINTIEWPKPGALNLSKVADKLSNNQWEITLTLQGKNLTSTDDVVLLIDRSGSMVLNQYGYYDPQKLEKAKDAAKRFVNTLLFNGNTTTRIAIVSFADGVSIDSGSVNNAFKGYADKESLLKAIDNISARGGTFTQAGLKQASALFSNNNSTAESKSIVLLSDGGATYSYNINNPDSYFEEYNGDLNIDYVTNESIPSAAFNYSAAPIGNGQQEYTLYKNYKGKKYYYSHGNSAISESKFVKDAGLTVYTVALNAGDEGNRTLEGIASSGKAYSVSTDSLEEMLETISGSISYAATGVTVTDPMGERFSIPSINKDNYKNKIKVNQGTITYNTATETIIWSLPTISEGNPATMTYTVEIDSNATSGVLYPTNEDTYLDYTNALGQPAKTYFDPIPMVGKNARTIIIYYYRVNSNGQPINSEGTVIPRENAVLQTSLFDDDGNPATPLQTNKNYSVGTENIKTIGGITYQYNVAGDSNPKIVKLTTSKPNAEVWFAYAPAYTVNYLAGSNGAITGATSQTVSYGGSTTAVTAVANLGYKFSSWDDGITNPIRNDNNVKADATYRATFVIDQNQKFGYKVNYYIEGTTTPVPGIAPNPYIGTAPIGTVTLPTPPTSNQGYIVKAGQPTNMTVTADGLAEANVYYVVDQTQQFGYKVNYYLQNVDGTYPTTPTYVDELVGTIGALVTAVAKAYEGYTYDVTIAGTVASGTIAGDGSLVLKLYYKKNYSITYQAGANGSFEGIASGVRKDLKFYGDSYSAAPTPVANSGYYFSGWTPALPGAEEKVTGDKTFTAYFALITSGGGGGGSKDRDDKDDTTVKTVTVVDEEIPAGVPELNKEEHFQYLQGYPDNTVRPEGNITREEVAAVFYRLLTKEYRESIMTTSHNFPDVEKGRWSTKYIATLAKGGILEGDPDGKYRPGDFMTKAELAVVASKFDKLSPFSGDMFKDISGHWANKYINSAAQKGWVKGNSDGTFNPDKYITRAEFATLVNNVLGRRVHKEDILPGARKFPDLHETDWYYEAMMEAINSHYYERSQDGYEKWTEIYYPDLDM